VHESDEMIERVTLALRGDAVTVAPDFDARVMEHVRAAMREDRGRGVWRWMTRARTVSVTPLGALALAAGLAVVIALAARRGDVGVRTGSSLPPVALTASGAAQPMNFVFVARSASSVAIVGDFNDWQEGASPLYQVTDSVWAITIPLAPGRYHYTFVVDGTRWVADPLAPRTIEDDFGRPNSVITVGDAST
jgi:Glycogen recognition site of AMP-activated protein kinase